jgi:hypothetical protein
MTYNSSERDVRFVTPRSNSTESAPQFFMVKINDRRCRRRVYRHSLSWTERGSESGGRKEQLEKEEGSLIIGGGGNGRVLQG